MMELHLSKKDFRVDWFSGSGAGGQHRNKHANCCRITHIETGISAQATASKSRVTNQKQAFAHLAARLIAHFTNPETSRRTRGQEVRRYHAERNEVYDHASGLRQSYKKVIGDGDGSDMIEARKQALDIQGVGL